MEKRKGFWWLRLLALVLVGMAGCHFELRAKYYTPLEITAPKNSKRRL